MNWNKISTIFIIIFLIINLVIYGISTWVEKEKYSLSQVRIDQLRNILEENDYAIYDHLPDFYPMTVLNFETPQRNKGAIVQGIFGDAQVTTSFAADYEKYKADGQSLYFYKGKEKGLVEYNVSTPVFTLDRFEQSKIEALGEEFAKAMMPDVEHLELTYIKAYEDYYVLEYNEIYKGQTLFCSYVNLKISREGVTMAQSMRYIPKGYEGKDMEIVPIDEVLYNFMGSVKPAENEFYSIKKIDLGYHLALEPMEGETTIEGVPYYRLKLDDESVYYINALTNEVKVAR